MEFFNRKEEVIELILTSHGRKKLRDGKFNPTYYAFSDASIIYDCRHQGFSGSQNEFVERLDEIPILKKSVFFSQDEKTNIFPQEMLNISILGSSELGQVKYPAFELKLYSGQLTGTIVYTGSNFLNNTQFPSCTINMKNIFDKNDNEFITQEALILELNELNGLFEKENFEIQLFKINDDQKKIPLHFAEQIKQQSQNGQYFYFEEIEMTPDQIEYWFDVDVDEQISDSIIFKLVNSPNPYGLSQNTMSGSQC